MKDKVEHANKKGRFPANLLLTHHPDCELIGEKKVKGSQSKEERTLIDDKIIMEIAEKADWVDSQTKTD